MSGFLVALFFTQFKFYILIFYLEEKIKIQSHTIHLFYPVITYRMFSLKFLYGLFCGWERSLRVPTCHAYTFVKIYQVKLLSLLGLRLFNEHVLDTLHKDHYGQSHLFCPVFKTLPKHWLWLKSSLTLPLCPEIDLWIFSLLLRRRDCPLLPHDHGLQLAVSTSISTQFILSNGHSLKYISASPHLLSKIHLLVKTFLSLSLNRLSSLWASISFICNSNNSPIHLTKILWK